MSLDNQMIKEGVLSKVRSLIKEGKEVTKGAFVTHQGNVQLWITDLNENQYHISYFYYSSMWNWTVNKKEVAA